MANAVKKGVALLIIAFGVFYLISQPEGAAAAIQGALSAVGDAFNQVVRFFTALLE